MALQTTKRMILPVVDETYQEHFDDRSWASPQDQVDAGYPIFTQPTNPTALFVYRHDTGALIDRDVLITVQAPTEHVVPTVEAACTISTSIDDVTYTDHDPGFQVFTGDFRWVKVTLDFVADDDHELAIVGPVRLRISLKKKREEGRGTSLASGATTVTFLKDFIDIRSIRVTPRHNASYPVIAVYDFEDVPFPETFDVYCFRTDTGAQVANEFSWEVTGV